MDCLINKFGLTVSEQSACDLSYHAIYCVQTVGMTEIGTFGQQKFYSVLVVSCPDHKLYLNVVNKRPRFQQVYII